MSSSGFSSFISAQIQHLLQGSSYPLKLENAWSGAKHSSENLDRFTLLIPYCLDVLRWDILYNAEYPLSPPDVIFGPEDDHFLSFLVSSRTISCLSDWNYRDQTQLLTLIEELRSSYVEYQKKKIGQVDDERLKFEVNTILSREGIEMHIMSLPDKTEEVKFAITLTDININRMVVECPWKHQQKIYLQVIYPISRKLVSVPSPPRLKLLSTTELKSLFSIDDVKLPAWLDGMCMAEYLPHAQELIKKQVSESLVALNERRHFLEALVPLLGHPLEADSVFCRKASFLAASSSFTFLVHFRLSIQFPKQQPSLQLQSAQHLNGQGTAATSQILTDYPWSPRWEAQQMAERISWVLCYFLAIIFVFIKFRVVQRFYM